MRWLFLNTIAFYTDPDAVCVRPVLTPEHARLWATLLGITGQLLMASDKMYALPEERVELLRRIFPVADIRPMELYPLDERQMPTLFDVKVRLPGIADWDVAALFNWDRKDATTFALSPERLGLDFKSWIGVDAWSGELLHAGEGKLELSLPPETCRAVSVWEDLQHPQFVGSSRHLTQGAVDLVALKWDPEKLRLSGRSLLVGGDPYRVRIHVPAGYRVATPGVEQKGTLAELIVRKEKSGKARWEIAFAK
jgi:hypothetical protein